MGYLHINNLYKDNRVLMLKELYALEKVHGTSAHIGFHRKEIPDLTFYSGGAKHETFVKLFDQAALREKLSNLGHDDVTVFGEAYGGSMQGMRDTYGDELRFIAFDVKIGDKWLNVEKAAKVAEDLGLEFVPYEKGPATVEWVNAQRDATSVVAVRRGCGQKPREGVVLRPLDELTTNNDSRVMAKHVADSFRERMHAPKVKAVDEAKLEVIKNAQAAAEEWVVPMRLTHVLDKLRAKLGREVEMTDAKELIAAMIEDVNREAAGEIVPGKELNAAISKKTVEIFKKRLQESLGA